MRKCCQITVSLLVLISLTACGPVTLPSVSTYTISGPVAIKVGKAKTNKTLLISLPFASPGYQSNKMAYVTIPFRLRYFAQNQWVAPPAEMLMTLFAEKLRQTNYFKAVMTAPFSGVTTYRLDTHLLILQQEFLRPISQVRLLLQATIINNMNNRVISSRRFQIVVNAPENNPYSGVLAANQAAAKLSARLAHFVLQTVR